MKFEKINDRQICCIISSQDLINNQIKLSELAFGSAKAKAFFRNLMMKAKNDCGFDGLNSPLMIEAVPQPPDSLKLIITKMNDNYNNFNNNNEPFEPEREKRNELHFEGVDSILNLIKNMKEPKSGNSSAKSTAEGLLNALGIFPEDAGSSDSSVPEKVIEAFRFADMESVILAAKALKDVYDGENSLYTETAQSTYLLTVRCVDETPEEFNKICNILTEYSLPVHCSESGENYLREHGNEMIADNALQILAGF